MDAIQSYRILIWSENPDKLVEFYRDVLGMEVAVKLELEDDYGYAVKTTDGLLIWIGKHSGVKGKNTEPLRHMFNLYVNDVHTWYEKIKNRDDAQIIQEPMITPPTRDKAPEEQRHVVTFLDPEGNCLQFMER